MSKSKTIWSLIIVVFILLLVGIFYYFNKDSFALFSDEIEGKRVIEVSVSNEGTCKNNVNPPVLEEGMIPVYFDSVEKVWKKADKENKDFNWYNYCEQKWANVVTVRDKGEELKKSPVGTAITEDNINTMFVWIPRYKYQIFNFNSDGNSSIKEQSVLLGFEKDIETTGNMSCEYKEGTLEEVCTTDEKVCKADSCNSKIYTHPSFAEKYTGFWVSKFELTGDLKEITIKPSLPSIRNASVRDFNDAISDMNKKNNIYGFSDDSDIHMITNLEWGAVSYFANSKYGINKNMSINNCDKFVTGIGAIYGSGATSLTCNNEENMYYGKEGMLASTTGNVYGIYDMSGGSSEYVLGVASKDNEIIPGLSGYTSSEKIKNIVMYNESTSSSDITISRLGDGIREVKNGSYSWYSDASYVSYSKWPWFVRGGNAHDGSSAGIFSSSYSSGTAGDDISTRVVITK